MFSAAKEVTSCSIAGSTETFTFSMSRKGSSRRSPFACSSEQLQQNDVHHESADTVADNGHADLAAEQRVLPGTIQGCQQARAGEVGSIEAGAAVRQKRLVVAAFEPNDVLEVETVGNVGDNRLLGPQAPALESPDRVARKASELVLGKAIEIHSPQVAHAEVELAEAGEILVFGNRERVLPIVLLLGVVLGGRGISPGLPPAAPEVPAGHRRAESLEIANELQLGAVGERVDRHDESGARVFVALVVVPLGEETDGRLEIR